MSARRTPLDERILELSESMRITDRAMERVARLVNGAFAAKLDAVHLVARQVGASRRVKRLLASAEKLLGVAQHLLMDQGDKLEARHRMAVQALARKATR